MSRTCCAASALLAAISPWIPDSVARDTKRWCRSAAAAGTCAGERGWAEMSVNDDTGERALLELGTVCDALAATPGADEWQVEALVTHERQAYRIGEREEARRAVKTELARVEGHNNHEPHDSEGLGRARGTATPPLVPRGHAHRERLRARPA